MKATNTAKPSFPQVRNSTNQTSQNKKSLTLRERFFIVAKDFKKKYRTKRTIFLVDENVLQSLQDAVKE